MLVTYDLFIDHNSCFVAQATAHIPYSFTVELPDTGKTFMSDTLMLDTGTKLLCQML